MTKSITNCPLERFISNYEAVAQFKAIHLFLGSFAVIAGGLIGVLALGILNYGPLPLNFGMTGNIVAAVVAGASITALAVIGILFHYAYKISNHYRESSEEFFLDALMDESTATLFDPQKGEKWVAMRFCRMLSTQFPEENWQAMMRYFDQRLFQRNAAYGPKIIAQVFNTLYKADTKRFLKNYFEMKQQGLLSVECIAFLNPKVTSLLRDMDWTPLLVEVDKTCFLKKNRSPVRVKYALLDQLYALNSVKFRGTFERLLKAKCSPDFYRFILYNLEQFEPNNKGLRS